MANLTIFYQNVRGLRTKCLQFRQNLLGNACDVVMITESWLHEGIYDGELCSSEYDVFRNDRDLKSSDKHTGGGVMILVKREFCARRCDALSLRPPTEMLSVTIPARALASTADLHICVAYVPPNAQRIPFDIDSILNAFTCTFDRNPGHNYLIVGDFNLPQINWNSGGPTYLKRGTIEIQNSGIKLVNSLSLLGLTQYNTLQNYAGNTLDLAFSNLPLSSR